MPKNFVNILYNIGNELGKRMEWKNDPTTIADDIAYLVIKLGRVAVGLLALYGLIFTDIEADVKGILGAIVGASLADSASRRDRL